MFSEHFGTSGSQIPETPNIFEMLQAILSSSWKETVKEYSLDITENATKTEMVDEAVDRMKMLGLSEDAISEFRNSGRPSFGMENGQRFPLGDFEMEQIQKLEGNGERLVYAVIRNNSCYGRMINYIMVSRYKCDWGLERMNLTERNSVTAYVYNFDVPAYSEAGKIEVERLPGGILGRRDCVM